jgi:hypothetical protein
VAAALVVPLAAGAQEGGVDVVCTGGVDVAAFASANPLAGLIGATAIAPFAQLTINGQSADLSRCISPLGNSKLWQLDADFFSGAAEGHVTATMNPDPFITFGATTTNLIGTPVTFAFLFGTPIVPGIYNSASSTGGVTVTPGVANDADVTSPGVYPTYISGYGTVGLVPTNLGVDNGAATCSATTANNTCNFGLVSSTFAPTFYDNLEALLTYNQDDANSVASCPAP